MKNVGLIGVGKMGMSHLAIANHTPGIKVLAISDTSKPLLRFFKKNTKFNCYSDYTKMIKENELDGVIISVPNSFHYPITKYCIEHGLNVFIEKPLTLLLDESYDLVKLIDKNKVKGQVGYVNRYNLIFQKVKNLLDEDVIGEIYNYSNKMSGAVITRENNKGWRNDYSKGGGCLFDFGPHCINLATYFFGNIDSIKGSSMKSVFSSKVDDIVNAILLHENGVIGSNYISWSDTSKRKAANSIEIEGKKGKIIANKQDIKVFLNKKSDNGNFLKGWNEIFVTDTKTDTEYYLRGEDFSLQMLEYSKLLNGEIEESISSLKSASVTDKIIAEIFEKSGGVING